MTDVEMWSVVDVFSMPERKRSGNKLYSLSKLAQSLKIDLLLDRIVLQKRAQLVHLFL